VPGDARIDSRGVKNTGNYDGADEFFRSNEERIQERYGRRIGRFEKCSQLVHSSVVVK